MGVLPRFKYELVDWIPATALKLMENNKVLYTPSYEALAYIGTASGPKIRKLKEWSKQTEYGGEV